MAKIIPPDIFPTFLSPADRKTIRKYLEASELNGMGNEVSFKALDSIESMQGAFESIRDHLLSRKSACDIDVDLLMMYIKGKL